MHIPDGFIGPGVSAAAGVAAAGGFGVALSRARGYLTDRMVPLAALTAAFVFAGQMVNFPVLPGMSGHLLGGVLAAVLVGPAAGYIIITIVLVVQALLFADGGLSALGLNIVNMALVGSVGGYYLYRLLYRVGGRKHSSVPVLAGIAAFASLPMSAAAFAVEFAIGGTAESVSMGAIWAALVGTHALIGVGEGVLTALVVGAVMSARPDLVYGAPTYAGGRTEELV